MKSEERPVVHERHHRTLSAPEVQAVIPVCPQPLADPCAARPARRRNPAPVSCARTPSLPPCRQMGRPVSKNARSPVSLTNSQIVVTIQSASSEQVSSRPWMISAALGVGTTVGSFTPGSLSSFGGKRPGQTGAARSLAHLPVEQLEDPLPGLSRVCVDDRHDVLRRVPVPEPRPSPHLDERRES